MWIINKWDELMVSLDSEIDEETESFLYKTYYIFVQLSLISLKMEKKYRPFYFWYLIINSTGYVLNYAVFINSMLYFSHYNFIIFSYTTHLFLLLHLIPIVLITFRMKEKDVKYVHRIAMEGFYDYQEPKLNEEYKLSEEMSRYKKMLLLMALFIVLTGVVFLVATKLDDDYGTFDFDAIANVSSIYHPFRFAVCPFHVNSGLSYFFILGLQLINTALLVLSAAMAGYMFTILALGIIYQLKILTIYLDNIEKRAMNMFNNLYDIGFDSLENMYASPEFSKCYNICLRKTFVHHQMIMKYFNCFNEIFSVITLASNTICTIVIGLSLLLSGKVIELPGTSLISMFLCIAEVGYMIIESYMGQIITDLSLDLRFKMYSTKWYYCNASTKRSLMIFQARTLIPLTIKAGRFIPINLALFATIMNSAYSYYNLINVLNAKG